MFIERKVMNKWIMEEPQTVFGCLAIVLLVSFLNITWMISTVPFFYSVLQTNDPTAAATTEIQKLGSMKIFYVLAAISFAEELIFRFCPLSISVSAGMKKSWTIYVALASSALFGWLHGGVVHIFMQGVAGFLYSLAYLKCGGWRGLVLKPLMVTTTAHLTWDLGIHLMISF
jgi:membrane protease YdiL (CAAX protease family)